MSQTIRKSHALLLAVAAACLLASRASAQAPSASPVEPVGLVKGDKVQPFDATAIDGTLTHVSFKSSTVVIFFLSSCPHCQHMIPLWNSAYARRPKGLEVVAVMLDQEAPGFFETMHVEFPVVRAPGETFAERRAF